MTVGDRVDLNGYVFYETLYGPLAEFACETCGRFAYAAECRSRQTVTDPAVVRCSACWRRHHGLTEGGEPL